VTLSPLQVVVAALEQHGGRVRHVGDQVDATCPAHDDQNPSLSVRYDRAAGKVLVNCHTGCSPDDVIATLGLTWSDLFDAKPDQDRASRPQIVATYDYADEQGVVVFQKVRYFPKDFRVRRPDGRGGWTWRIGDAPRVLYRLRELRAAVAGGRAVLVVEGEKDADRVAEQLGMAATCNYEGAAKDGQRTKWRREYTEQLRGANVLVVADNDESGHAHARAVAAALDGVAAAVRVFRLAVDEVKADTTHHLDAGFGLEDLVPLDIAQQMDDQPGEDAAVLVSLSTVQPEELQWLWEGRIPRGKIVTLDGDPSVGKSTLAVDVAAHVSMGKPWPDGVPCEQGDVLILSAEDGLADTIRPRLDAAGGDPARVHALTAVRSVDDNGKILERPPTLADVSQIRTAILRTGAVLVVIDVLMAFLPGKVDSHKDQDIRAVLSRLTKVGEETGASFLLLRHLNKAGGGSPMYRGGGSIGIVGAARAGYLVARDPDDPDTRVMACIKSNLAREPESLSYRLESTPGSHVAHVVWTGASTHDAAGLLRTGFDDEGEGSDARSSAERWLTDYLVEHGGAAKASDAMKAAKADDIAERTLRRARERAGVKVERKGFGQGAVWTYDPIDTPSRPHSGHSGQPSEPGRNGRNGGRNDDGPSS
jgi:putative DNA primase/helicase